LTVILVEEIPEVEKNIVLNCLHFNRGDVNESLIRSTQSRVKYKGHHFPVFNAVDIKRGDVIIESSLYGHYAGELQIAKRDMKNTGKTNVVGRVRTEELYLLDDIQPWEKFVLKEVQ
ncbi:phospho-sugar glycosidase domain-containing protein, partial [Cetobacterium sp.]|uniref:phospho-sugar glycosidase domain-containing protein n=1 Tax=Cetobacterium sp. TaxID=2071632 RepID=UPI003EE80BE3